MRKDHIKLTILGISRLLDSVDGMVTPSEAIKHLPAELQPLQWVVEAKSEWDDKTNWSDALGAAGSMTSVIDIGE